MVEELAQDQRRDGSFSDAKQTITCSRGQSPIIETTSFAILAMMRVSFEKWNRHIAKAVNFLMKVMERGYFGSSPASVLAFKALTEYLRQVEPAQEFPRFQIKVNGLAHHIQTGDPLKRHKNRNTFDLFNLRNQLSGTG